MRTSGAAWWAVGLLAGAAGLATSQATSMLMAREDGAVASVAEGVVRLVPGAVAERAIEALGHHDKTVLVAGVVVLTLILAGTAGRLARRRPALGAAVLVGLAAVGAVATLAQPGAMVPDLAPIVVGLLTWLGALLWLAAALRRDTDPGPDPGPAPGAWAGASRRELLVRGGIVLAGTAAAGVLGRVAGGGRRRVEAARRLLRLPGVTRPDPPAGVRVGPRGVTRWATTVEDFYRIDTAIVPPTIEPDEWRLRIHGMVDREVEVTYRELVARRPSQAWVTLTCVSNPVGGELIGNAWWSGVRVADLLAEAGVRSGADAVLQTSADGWTCSTPLEALTDDRAALLAVAMNGEPLPVEHGFPVRTVVPGLYGYVSACKWVVDLEVTRFADVTAYWTERGWGEQGPIKLSSRIDVPRDGGQVAAGGRIGGVAWAQHTGVSAVEYAVDGGPWLPAELGAVPTSDTWVQWAATLHAEPGHHTLQVRAVDAQGRAQTGVRRDVLPDGATGWHTIRVEVTG